MWNGTKVVATPVIHIRWFPLKVTDLDLVRLLSELLLSLSVRESLPTMANCICVRMVAHIQLFSRPTVDEPHGYDRGTCQWKSCYCGIPYLRMVFYIY